MTNTIVNEIATRFRMQGDTRSEFERLYDLCVEIGISSPTQLSLFIRENRLGEMFPNLSGYLTHSRGRDTWKFEGGLAPFAYRAICEALNFYQKPSDARAEDYESFAEHKRRTGRFHEYTHREILAWC